MQVLITNIYSVRIRVLYRIFESSQWNAYNQIHCDETKQTPQWWSEARTQENHRQGPVVQSVVSLTSTLRVISLTILVDSIHNIVIFFAEKMWIAFALQKLLTFFQQKNQHICVSLEVNFNESLTNDVVSFEQLGPGPQWAQPQTLTVRRRPCDTDWGESRHLDWGPTHRRATEEGSKAINHNWGNNHACNLPQNIHIVTYLFVASVASSRSSIKILQNTQCLVQLSKAFKLYFAWQNKDGTLKIASGIDH